MQRYMNKLSAFLLLKSSQIKGWGGIFLSPAPPFRSSFRLQSLYLIPHNYPHPDPSSSQRHILFAFPLILLFNVLIKSYFFAYKGD